MRPRSIAFCHCIALLAVIAVHTAPARTLPPPELFDRFDGCLLVPDQLTDGDSFLARLPNGRNVMFRLYFVDAAEEHLSGKRSTRQARYFRITPGRLAALGREARAFTARALVEPFTLFTRWQSNFDEGRYFAFMRTFDDKDLAELLVRNGLAIPRGARAPTQYGRGSSSQVRRPRSWSGLRSENASAAGHNHDARLHRSHQRMGHGTRLWMGSMWTGRGSHR